MNHDVKTRRVALLIKREGSYSQAVLTGILRFVATMGRWRIEGADPVREAVVPLSHWKPDGIIGAFWNLEAARRFKSRFAARCPIVDTFGWYPELGLPLARCDEAEIGRLAAEHLIQRGLQNFGYCAYEWHPYARQRGDSFEQAIRAARPSATFVRYDHGPATAWAAIAWAAADDQLRAWVRSLPKPIGIMATNDHWGTRIMEACRMESLRVPEDVAVMGVDDDRLLCGFSQPPLTSIDTGAEHVGFAAARLLDELMRTGRRSRGATRRVVTVPPLRVVTRQSTDVLATTDPTLVDALHFIRENATRLTRRGLRKLDVAAVAEHVAVPRRRLERRFHAMLGHGPHQEIQRVRINSAKDLLASTDLPMPAIAARAGFNSHTRFIKVFRAATGYTPTAYRKRLSVS